MLKICLIYLHTEQIGKKNLQKTLMPEFIKYVTPILEANKAKSFQDKFIDMIKINNDDALQKKMQDRIYLNKEKILNKILVNAKEKN